MATDGCWWPPMATYVRRWPPKPADCLLHQVTRAVTLGAVKMASYDSSKEV